jgi:hypothetical protein
MLRGGEAFRVIDSLAALLKHSVIYRLLARELEEFRQKPRRHSFLS